MKHNLKFLILNLLYKNGKLLDCISHFPSFERTKKKKISDIYESMEMAGLFFKPVLLHTWNRQMDNFHGKWRRNRKKNIFQNHSLKFFMLGKNWTPLTMQGHIWLCPVSTWSHPKYLKTTIKIHKFIPGKVPLISSKHITQ